MMNELLGRKTTMKIKHIDDGTQIEPNTVFLNRPNSSAVLEDGVFRTREYQSNDNLPHLPIDTFFASLPPRNMAHTAAVILSGSGSDGTRGTQAVHNSGGAVIAQSPSEADFPSMPKALITAGNADHILKAADMPSAIAQIFEQGRRVQLNLGGERQDTAKEILRLLEEQHNIDFTPYKADNVVRRIERRQHLRGLKSMDAYLQQMHENTSVIDELYQDLLIGVTHFFRDPQAMILLRKMVIEPLVANATPDKPLRIWVPGCASGQEAYTIAMLVAETIRESQATCQFRIIATDVHKRSLDIASAGVYTTDSIQNIPEELRHRYFQNSGDNWTVSHDLRQRIIFSIHNALTDPPFLDLDLVSFRNVLIYFKDEAQIRVLAMFLFGLKSEGYLFLGPSESLGQHSDDFTVIESRWRLFQKKSTRSRHLNPALLSSTVGRRVNRPYQDLIEPVPARKRNSMLQDVSETRSRETLMRSYDLLLKQYAPSSILITSDGSVLSWFGTASAFIDTMNNMAEWTVEGVIHPDLQFVINVGIQKLRSGELESLSRKVSVDMGTNHRQTCVLTLEALEMSLTPQLMLVRIQLEEDPDEQPRAAESLEVSTTTSEDTALLARRIRELERDLKLTEETLQHVTERLEASGEELQASNEELHAVNEELVSLSTEHERKIELYTALNSETDYLLKALGIGVIVVDADLRILRFSTLVASAFEMEAHDVRRNLRIIGPRLDFVDLPALTAQVIENNEIALVSGAQDGTNYAIEVHPMQTDMVGGEMPSAVLIFKSLPAA